MLHINDLPDLCLRTIFAHLPLRDLLQLDRVCPHWKRLQPSVCLKRHSVTILIGDDVVSLMKHSPFSFPYHDQLRLSKDETHIPIAISIENAHNQLEFDWLDSVSAGMIANLLPNINTLCIGLVEVVPAICIGVKSWGNKSVLMDHIILLLQSWSSKLQTLKLYINFSNSNANQQIEGDLRRLVASINSCQSLKHLTFELQDLFDYESDDKPVELSICSRLNEFYFEFQENLEMITDSLVKYGATNPNLRAIGLGRLDHDDLESGFLRRFDDNFAQKFVQFPSLQFIKANSQLTSFCDRFSRLRSLSLRIDSDIMKIYKLIKSIRSLRELVYLNFNVYLDIESDDDNEPNDADDEPEEPELESIPRIGSIKIIHMYATLHSHEEMQLIKWQQMFPNLQILHFDDGWFECSTCKSADEQDNDDDDDDEDDEGKRRNECLKQCLQPWKGCEQLHSIYTGDFGCDSVKKWSLKDVWIEKDKAQSIITK